MKKILLPLLAFLCVTQFGNASDKFTFSVGVDLFDSVSKNDGMNRKQSALSNPLSSANRISTGITYKPFDFSEIRFTYKTNSLINFGEMYETKNGYNVSSQIKTQSYIVSRPVSRKIVPFIVGSDVTSIVSMNGGKDITTNGFMYGFGLTYIFLKNNGLSFTYFLPAEKFNTQYSYGLSYSYFI
jgi:hypothetical protein